MKYNLLDRFFPLPIIQNSNKHRSTIQKFVEGAWLIETGQGLLGKLMCWPTSESCKLYEPLPSIDILPLYLQISLAHEIRGQPTRGQNLATQCMQTGNITPGRLQITKDDLATLTPLCWSCHSGCSFGRSCSCWSLSRRTPPRAPRGSPAWPSSCSCWTQSWAPLHLGPRNH